MTRSDNLSGMIGDANSAENRRGQSVTCQIDCETGQLNSDRTLLLIKSSNIGDSNSPT